MICLFALAISLVLFVSPVFAEDATESIESLTERYKELLAEGEKQSLSDFLNNEKTEEEEKTDDFSDEMSGFFSSIPKDIRSELPYIEKLENGGVIDPSDISPDGIAEKLFGILKEGLSGAVKKLPRFAALIMLAYILKSIVNIYQSELSGIASLIVSCVIALDFFSGDMVNVAFISEYLEILTQCATMLSTLMVSIFISSGNVTTAAVTASSISVICSGIHFLFSNVIMPLVSMSFALTIAGASGLCDFAKGLADFFRKCAIWLIVIVSTFATFILSMQNLLARSADTIGIRTVKFALGSFVPIVGGAVGEAVNTVSAGFLYLKNACGIVGIIVILFIVLAPLTTVLAAKITLTVSSWIASLLECQTEGEMLSQLSGTVDCLLALLICSGVVFTVFLLGLVSANLTAGG